MVSDDEHMRTGNLVRPAEPILRGVAVRSEQSMRQLWFVHLLQCMQRRDGVWLLRRQQRLFRRHVAGSCRQDVSELGLEQFKVLCAPTVHRRQL